MSVLASRKAKYCELFADCWNARYLSYSKITDLTQARAKMGKDPTPRRPTLPKQNQARASVS
jgi:hypothetical protein